MSVNFYTGANQITVKNTLTDELKTSYDDAVELVNKLGGDATVEGSVAQRIAAIVANAPEKYDTLKEIATWIESDTDGAAKMQADIATLEVDKLDKTSVSSWAKASTKPNYTASEINLSDGTSVESAISTLNSNIDSLKDTNKYMTIGHTNIMNTRGWYSIAKITSPDSNIVNGSSDNSIDIILKREYDTHNNEHHELKFLSIYNNSKFVSIANLSNTQLITKIRYTKEGFLEVYYAGGHNIVSCTILNRYISSFTYCWEILFKPSDTTDDKVLCVFDIPATD